MVAAVTDKSRLHPVSRIGHIGMDLQLREQRERSTMQPRERKSGGWGGGGKNSHENRERAW